MPEIYMVFPVTQGLGFDCLCSSRCHPLPWQLCEVMPAVQKDPKSILRFDACLERQYHVSPSCGLLFVVADRMLHFVVRRGEVRG